MVYLIVFSRRGNYIIKSKNKKLTNLAEYEVVGKMRTEHIREYYEARNYPKESIKAIFEND